MKILIINGPNLNMLGVREKNIYGDMNYDDMCMYLKNKATEMELEIDIVQSNIEGEIINHIHNAYKKYDGIIINPAAYTHYSIAIYDALKSVEIKVIEVHLSNIYSREEFRRKSVTAPACIGQISGFGPFSYVLAMEVFKNFHKR